MVFTCLYLFALLACLVIWLVIKHKRPNFENKGIGIINFGKLFQNSTVDSLNCFLNTGFKSLLHLGLSGPELW